MKSENVDRNPIIKELRVVWSCFAFFGMKGEGGKRNFRKTSDLSFAVFVLECHCCNSLLTSHMFLINIPNGSRVERKCTFTPVDPICKNVREISILKI